MLESWEDVVQFFYFLFQLCVLFVIVVAIGLFCLAAGGFLLGTLFPSKPLEYPKPLDVCYGTVVNTVNQDHVMTVDYINLRGDTVYLVYKPFSTTLQSKQVIDGSDCPQ